RALRMHPELRPAGANVNFVVVRNANAIEVRTYERGVEAETLSCGSGVVASAVSSALFAKTKSPVKVLTRSGITLEVSFALDGGEADRRALPARGRAGAGLRLGRTRHGFFWQHPVRRAAADRGDDDDCRRADAAHGVRDHRSGGVRGGGRGNSTRNGALASRR